MLATGAAGWNDSVSAPSQTAKSPASESHRQGPHSATMGTPERAQGSEVHSENDHCSQGNVVT